MNVSSMNSERKLCVQSTIEKESAVVVLYLHSTSSHNARGKQTSQSLVVLYLHSTSNHNIPLTLLIFSRLKTILDDMKLFDEAYLIQSY